MELGGVSTRNPQHRACPDANILGDLLGQREQQVLGFDISVAEVQGFAERPLEDPLGTGRERDAAGPLRLASSELRAQALGCEAVALEHRCRRPVPFLRDTQEQVLGADVGVVEQPGLFLGQDHDVAGSLGEPFEHPLMVPRRRQRFPVM